MSETGYALGKMPEPQNGEEVKECLRHSREVLRKAFGDLFGRTTFDFALEYIQQLESAQPKWISVEERLPEPNRKVLTIRMDFSGKGRHIYALDNIIPWTNDTPFIWLADLETWKNRVTHWMEIPQPPKEDV